MVKLTIEELLITAKSIINDVLSQLDDCQCKQTLQTIDENLQQIINDKNVQENCPRIEQIIEYEITLSKALNKQTDFNKVKPFKNL